MIVNKEDFDAAASQLLANKDDTNAEELCVTEFELAYQVLNEFREHLFGERLPYGTEFQQG